MRMLEEEVEVCIIPDLMVKSFKSLNAYANLCKFNVGNCFECDRQRKECAGYLTRKREKDYWLVMGGFG